MVWKQFCPIRFPILWIFFLSALDEDEPFDICIVDIGDSQGEGIGLASKIRDNDELYSSIRLFAVSFPTSGCAKRCEEAGFDAFPYHTP